jgi:hypothetical protein
VPFIRTPPPLMTLAEAAARTAPMEVSGMLAGSCARVAGLVLVKPRSMPNSLLARMSRLVIGTGTLLRRWWLAADLV